jgi:transposase-like protein
VIWGLEARVQDISPARLEGLVQALNQEGLGDGEATRLCRELVAALERCRARTFEGPYPYLYLDGTILQRWA